MTISQPAPVSQCYSNRFLSQLSTSRLASSTLCYTIPLPAIRYRVCALGIWMVYAEKRAPRKWHLCYRMRGRVQLAVVRANSLSRSVAVAVNRRSVNRADPYYKEDAGLYRPGPCLPVWSSLVYLRGCCRDFQSSRKPAKKTRDLRRFCGSSNDCGGFFGPVHEPRLVQTQRGSERFDTKHKLGACVF